MHCVALLCRELPMGDSKGLASSLLPRPWVTTPSARRLVGVVLLALVACGGPPYDENPEPDASRVQGPDATTADAGRRDGGAGADSGHRADAGDAADAADGHHAPDAGLTVRCGDGQCSFTESCRTCPVDCGACPAVKLPCSGEGGLYCGGDGVGGDPNTLYVCHAGFLQLLKNCGVHCQYMPAGIPDQCPGALPVPASVVSQISAKPYVEQSCQPTTYPGWPYSAQKCTYSSGGLTATVTVADPSADRVARWIVDSGQFIPALAALRGAHQAEYEEGLRAIGLAMLYQSSRIYPLVGGIIEDQGGGYVDYSFQSGVTTTCSTGCYCRINSIHRTEWCQYRAATGVQSYSACLAVVGTSGLTAGWGNECFQNHLRSWTLDSNEHFRAKAYLANQIIIGKCPAGACTPAQVVLALKSAYGL